MATAPISTRTSRARTQGRLEQQRHRARSGPRHAGYVRLLMWPVIPVVLICGRAVALSMQ
jgi:hypothetical protein